MVVLQQGYLVTLAVALAGFGLACFWLLDVEGAPAAWRHFLGCGLCGFGTAFVCMRASRYYTDYAFEPVRRIAEASTTGHGTTIIVGLAVGLESVVVPVLTVGVAVVASCACRAEMGRGDAAAATRIFRGDPRAPVGTTWAARRASAAAPRPRPRPRASSGPRWRRWACSPLRSTCWR